MLDYIKIRNYKSIVNVELDNLKRINILIGKNNVGKSNILSFIYFLGINSFTKNNSLKTKSLDSKVDFYNGDTNNQIEFSIRMTDLVPTIKPIIDTHRPLIDFKILFSGDGAASELELVSSDYEQFGEEFVRSFVAKHLNTLEGAFSDRLDQFNNYLLRNFPYSFPHVIYIDDTYKLKSNKTIRKSLHEIVNHSFRNQQMRDKKNALYRFCSNLLGKNVEIVIPDMDQEVELRIGETHYSLDFFGSGIHRLLLLAIYIASTDKSIICLDEPELNLHPSLQRKFIKYIFEETEHQYFISTHSNTFLDFEIDKSIYHVEMTSGSTKSTHIRSYSDSYGILSDLGIRSSEIFQANGIIWVEGPSDRIYIKKWIELKFPKLVEGLNYTFQFYGGKILTHYSVTDDFYNEFVSMLLINRNAFIYMDSDLDFDYDISDLSNTKIRVLNECNESGINVWVSAGLEIENYITDSVLQKFANRNNINRNVHTRINKYCPEYKNKVNDSKRISAFMDDNIFKNNYDLNEKISLLCSVIQSWN